MSKIFKKIIPYKLLKLIKYLNTYDQIKSEVNMFYDNTCFVYYKDNYERQLKYSNNPNHNDTSEKILSSIVISYHGVEKGLTMGEMKLGFGKEKILELVQLCNSYIDRYNDFPDRLREATCVLSEYVSIHKKNGYLLDEELKSVINDLVIRCKVQPEELLQIQMKGEEYFRNFDSSFNLFSNSRHSLRDFSGEEVPLISIEQAIKLAQNAPSTCNRQSSQVYVIRNNELKTNVFSLQNGCRGFGDRASSILVVTSDLQAWGFGEQWFGPYIDGGIYMMNLLYALHFYKVGACALNWYASIENDMKLRKLLQIPDNEIVIAMIACGSLKEKFKLAHSKRKNYKTIMKILD